MSISEKEQWFTEQFEELLQPIRDPSQNWDVDIVSKLKILENYLNADDLDELGIGLSSDGGKGKSTLTFAKAAMVIQGSTAVYSKKVEYLHGLVLQALELVSQQKTAEKSKQQGSTDISYEEKLLFSSDPSFLLLNDIPEGQQIDLMYDGDDSILETRRRSSKGRLSNMSDISRASMILMHSILQEDHGGGSLKMSSCLMDESGALLIGGALVADREAFVGSAVKLGRQALTPFGNADGHITTAVHFNPVEVQRDYVERDANFPEGGDTGGGYEFSNGPNDEYNDDNEDYHDDGGNDSQPFTAEGIEMNTFAAVTSSSSSSSGELGEVVSRIDPNSKLDNVDISVQHQLRPNRNLLELLDPHEELPGSRPVKKGKCFKVPASLNNRKTQMTAPSSSFGSQSSEIDSSILPHLAFDNMMKGIYPLKGLSNPCFQMIQKEQNRLKLANRLRTSRERRTQLLSTFLYQQPDQIEDDPVGPVDRDFYGEEDGRTKHGHLPLSVADDNVSGGDDSDNDVGAFWGHGADGDADDNYYDAENEEGPPILASDSAEAISNNYAAESNLDEDEVLARRVHDALEDSLNSSQTTTYESLCRRHIDNFMRGAELYARETGLSARVSAWTRSLEVVLVDQEMRPQFDIHVYSDRVLSRIGAVMEEKQQISSSREEEEEEDSLGNSHVSQQRKSKRGIVEEEVDDEEMINFSSIVQGESSFEVCRVFLACLQLANLGNLSLRDDPDNRLAENGFSLKMVNSKRRADIENYRAPSLDTD